MGVANESAGRRLALRVWKRVMPEPRWPTGFVDLPRDAPPRREAGGPEVWWAMGIACVVAFVGYIVSMFGIVRVNSAGLSAWVPSWWLVLTIGLTFLEQRSTERPSPRVTVVRSAAVALMGALSAFLVHVMLSNRLLALGHYGDNPIAPVGAVLGCAIVPIAPFVALVALFALRRGRAFTHRALSWLVAASVLALAVLVVGASVRHLRAPDVARTSARDVAGAFLHAPPRSLGAPSAR